MLAAGGGPPGRAKAFKAAAAAQEALGWKTKVRSKQFSISASTGARPRPYGVGRLCPCSRPKRTRGRRRRTRRRQRGARMGRSWRKTRRKRQARMKTRSLAGLSSSQSRSRWGPLMSERPRTESGSEGGGGGGGVQRGAVEHLQIFGLVLFN